MPVFTVAREEISDQEAERLEFQWLVHQVLIWLQERCRFELEK